MLEHRVEVTSTNDVVRAWIAQGTAHGRAVYADAQTAGRGRLGRSWYSPPGESLYLSVAIVDPGFSSLLSLIPLAVGVAAAQVVERELSVRVGLKWPNDLWLGGRKLGGILCEGVLSGATVKGVVVGIGLNVNTAPENVPEALRDVLTSISARTGRSHDVGRLAEALRAQIVETCNGLLGGHAAMIDAWRSFDITRGRAVRLQDGRAGRALGILNDGALEVETTDGPKAIRTGEIVFIAPSTNN